jgi:hypothetical protein
MKKKKIRKKNKYQKGTLIFKIFFKDQVKYNN